jgi:DNA-binding IclR family transcriptional regulator
VRHLDPGDPSDLEILRALGAHRAGAVPGDELAAALGVSSEKVRVRIGSLLSLGYVERAGAAGHTGGYQLTERGWAELRRRLPTAGD